MDKLLNAIASGLNIRAVVCKQSEEALQNDLIITTRMFVYKDVTYNVRRIFKRELKKHLLSKLSKIEVGEYVDYSFSYGKVKHLGTIIKEANDNMAEVLLKLPKLKEGENYEFPPNTYISFKLIDRYETGGTVEINIISPWIMEKYGKQ